MLGRTNVSGGGGGKKGFFPSVFVTGLQESDTVKLYKGTPQSYTKVYDGVWTTREGTEVPLIPTMTSNTTPSGTASFVNITSITSDAYKAFDGSDSTLAYGNGSTNVFPKGVVYDFGTTKTVSRIAVKWSPWTTGATATVEVQTSLDSSTWTTAYTESVTATSTSEVREINVNAPISLRYVRFVATSVTSPSGGMPQVYSMQVYSDTEQVSGFLIDEIEELGTYTLESTRGTSTRTETILIDAPIEYDLEISMKLYLYRYGDECEGVTGGWSADGYTWSPYQVVSGTKEAGYLYCDGGLSNGFTLFGTAIKVDTTGYTKLCAEVSLGGSNPTLYANVGIATSKALSGSNTVKKNFTTKASHYTVDMDITSYQDEYYIFAESDGVNRLLSVHKVWLE